MPRTYTSIWIHSIWATKNREGLLARRFRLLLFDHIKNSAEAKGFYVDIINGIEDHVHCLFGMKPTQNVSDVIKNIKGESSRWIDEKAWVDGLFSWQEGYAAFSVSPSNLARVRKYVYNQESHHQNLTFEEEIIQLEKAANLTQ